VFFFFFFFSFFFFPFPLVDEKRAYFSSLFSFSGSGIERGPVFVQFFPPPFLSHRLACEDLFGGAVKESLFSFVRPPARRRRFHRLVFSPFSSPRGKGACFSTTASLRARPSFSFRCRGGERRFVTAGSSLLGIDAWARLPSVFIYLFFFHASAHSFFFFSLRR